MATILPFVVRPRASSSARMPATDAAIVIFPGVRYEAARAEGAGERRKVATSRKRKDKSV